MTLYRLMTEDEYQGIMSHLKSAIIECKTANERCLFSQNNSYNLCEIDRHLEEIKDLLDKEE